MADNESILRARIYELQGEKQGWMYEADHLRDVLKTLLSELDLHAEADALMEIEAEGAGLSDAERNRLAAITEARDAAYPPQTARPINDLSDDREALASAGIEEGE